jgi:hypothetical protein
MRGGVYAALYVSVVSLRYINRAWKASTIDAAILKSNPKTPR